MLRGRRQTYLVALETKVLSQGNVGLNTSDCDSEKLARRLLRDLVPAGHVANRSNREYLQKTPAATVIKQEPQECSNPIAPSPRTPCHRSVLPCRSRRRTRVGRAHLRFHRRDSAGEHRQMSRSQHRRRARQLARRACTASHANASHGNRQTCEEAYHLRLIFAMLHKEAGGHKNRPLTPLRRRLKPYSSSF